MAPSSSFLSFLTLPPNPLLPLATPQPFSLSFSLLPQSPHSPSSTPPSLRSSLPPQETSRPSDPLPLFCPSLGLVNLVFCKDTFNVQVIDEDPDEPEDALISRFSREVYRAGVIREAYRRRFHENKREKRIRKRKEAAMRNRRRHPPPKEPEEEEGSSNRDGYDDEDDNWDFVDVEPPYC